MCIRDRSLTFWPLRGLFGSYVWYFNSLSDCFMTLIEIYFQNYFLHKTIQKIMLIICEQIVELKIAELYHGLLKQHLVLQVKQIQIA